jgi:hypothetical protein
MKNINNTIKNCLIQHIVYLLDKHLNESNTKCLKILEDVVYKENWFHDYENDVYNWSFFTSFLVETENVLRCYVEFRKELNPRHCSGCFYENTCNHF